MAAPTSMIVLAAASTLLYCISTLPPASHWLPLLQAYIPDLIECLEREGLRPVPIFINGVEAHTVVSLYLPLNCAPCSVLPPLMWPASARSCLWWRIHQREAPNACPRSMC